jgi:hypothetical protein
MKAFGGSLDTGWRREQMVAPPYGNFNTTGKGIIVKRILV